MTDAASVRRVTSSPTAPREVRDLDRDTSAGPQAIFRPAEQQTILHPAETQTVSHPAEPHTISRSAGPALGNGGLGASPQADDVPVENMVASSGQMDRAPIATRPGSKPGSWSRERIATGLKDRTPREAVQFKGAVAGEIVSSINGAIKTDQFGFTPDAARDAANLALLSGSGHSGSSQPVGKATGGLTDRDAFVALDRDMGSPAATWIQTGARRAEAGFQDPALGWVGVRAQSGGGGAVHAAVVPGSPDAAQALSGHLSGLNAYMAEHHGQNSVVTMAAPESARGDRESGYGQNMNHESQRQHAQQQEPHAADERGRRGDVGGGRKIPSNQPEAVVPIVGRGSGSTGSGSHISVIA
jgi:hypothetical protein